MNITDYTRAERAALEALRIIDISELPSNRIQKSEGLVVRVDI